MPSKRPNTQHMMFVGVGGWGNYGRSCQWRGRVRCGVWRETGAGGEVLSSGLVLVPPSPLPQIKHDGFIMAKLEAEKRTRKRNILFELDLFRSLRLSRIIGDRKLEEMIVADNSMFIYTVAIIFGGRSRRSFLLINSWRSWMFWEIIVLVAYSWRSLFLGAYSWRSFLNIIVYFLFDATQGLGPCRASARTPNTLERAREALRATGLGT